ncbi:MAG: hypothetical protein KAT70_05905 [Thermoplasmata archaeon]|nr:hypothetical protein [Thermoplasmata archaeon]
MEMVDPNVERQRLAKLWDAYEIQERDLIEAKERIRALDMELEEKTTMLGTLKGVIESRDRDVRDTEIKLVSLEKMHEKSGSAKEDLEKEVRRANERFTKLYSIAEEMEIELKDLRKKLRMRDDWFKDNIDVIKMMVRAIEERENMIAPLGEAPSVREIQTLQ